MQACPFLRQVSLKIIHTFDSSFSKFRPEKKSGPNTKHMTKLPMRALGTAFAMLNTQR